MTNQELTSLRDGRRAPRFPTKLKALLRFGHRRVPIVIADISRTGAMVFGAKLPPRGARVMLLAQGLEVVATIIWSDSESCGLNFHGTVDPLAIVRDNMAQFAWLKRRPSEPSEPVAA
jgi:hypothetical protein